MGAGLRVIHSSCQRVSSGLLRMLSQAHSLTLFKSRGMQDGGCKKGMFPLAYKATALIWSSDNLGSEPEVAWPLDSVHLLAVQMVNGTQSLALPQKISYRQDGACKR